MRRCGRLNVNFLPFIITREHRQRTMGAAIPPRARVASHVVLNRPWWEIVVIPPPYVCVCVFVSMYRWMCSHLQTRRMAKVHRSDDDNNNAWSDTQPKQLHKTEHVCTESLFGRFCKGKYKQKNTIKSVHSFSLCIYICISLRRDILLRSLFRSPFHTKTTHTC